MTTGRAVNDGSAADVWVWSFAAALLRRRYLIIGLAAVLALVVGLASILRPRHYTASASFIPQEPSVAQPTVSQLAAQFGIAPPRGAGMSPQFYADLLVSRELLREVLNRRYETPNFKGTLFEYLRIRADDRYALARAIERFRKLLHVQPNRTTGVVSFEVQTRYSDLSIDIVRTMLRLVNDYNLKRRQSQGRAEREFTEQRVSAAQQALTAAENELARFHASNRRFSDSPILTAEEARLQRQVLMQQELYISLSQNHEAAKIEELRSTPVTTVVDSPEGFVEPRRRGTVGKAIAGGFAGGLVGVVIAFALEFIKRAQKGPTDDYQEFEALWRVALADLSRPFRRRSLSS
jgi:uncharacterized protein involved in exopolysaccharide biosynthesis